MSAQALHTAATLNTNFFHFLLLSAAKSAIIVQIIGLVYVSEYADVYRFGGKGGQQSEMEVFADFFAQLGRMRWQDFVDILLVSTLIFFLIPMLRSSGAMRIVWTISLLGVVWALTRLFNLYLLQYVLNIVWNVGLIAVIILFQPELRRMLDQLGKVKLKNLLGLSKPNEEMVPIIQQTVMACEVMSRERVGALMVFARDNALDEYFRTGTMIEAKVSEQLIRNIFFPKAALHDGAMIIRDGKIAAAGCVLPLSESHSLSADLGTRHRAGVGMSEASDAVVVIVSEETGTISVAVGGVLKRYLAPQTLERLLRNELCKAPAANPQRQVLWQRLQKKQKGGHGDEK